MEAVVLACNDQCKHLTWGSESGQGYARKLDKLVKQQSSHINYTNYESKYMHALDFGE